MHTFGRDENTESKTFLIWVQKGQKMKLTYLKKPFLNALTITQITNDAFAIAVCEAAAKSRLYLEKHGQWA